MSARPGHVRDGTLTRRSEPLHRNTHMDSSDDGGDKPQASISLATVGPPRRQVSLDLPVPTTNSSRGGSRTTGRTARMFVAEHYLLLKIDSSISRAEALYESELSDGADSVVETHFRVLPEAHNVTSQQRSQRRANTTPVALPVAARHSSRRYVGSLIEVNLFL